MNKKQNQEQRRHDEMLVWCALMFWIIFLVAFSFKVNADQMVHKFKSPSFSGIGTSAHYLTIENQEHMRKMTIKEEISRILGASLYFFSSYNNQSTSITLHQNQSLSTTIHATLIHSPVELDHHHYCTEVLAR